MKARSVHLSLETRNKRTCACCVTDEFWEAAAKELGLTLKEIRAKKHAIRYFPDTGMAKIEPYGSHPTGQTCDFCRALTDEEKDAQLKAESLRAGLKPLKKAFARVGASAAQRREALDKILAIRTTV